MHRVVIHGPERTYPPSAVWGLYKNQPQAVLRFVLLERQVRQTISHTGQKIRGRMPEPRDTTKPKGVR